MPTVDQIRTLQIARRKVKLSEPQYRTLLRNVAGVDSCKELDNSSFEDVMAVLEDFGVRISDHRPDNYWRSKVQQRGAAAGERMVHKIRDLAGQQSRYPLAAVCLRMSDGRTDQPHKLVPREAWNVIEMLKAIVDRETPAAVAASDDDLPF